MTIKIFLAITIFISLSFSCSPYYIEHDVNKAANTANNFANLAFINKNYERAYLLLSNKKPSNFSVLDLEKMVLDMHPNETFPLEIDMNEYDIVPRESVIRIYGVGKLLSGNQFSYCIILYGNKTEDYSVIEFYRGDQKLPSSSSIKPLIKKNQ